MAINIVSARPPHKGVACVVFELGRDQDGRAVLVAGGIDCSDGAYSLRKPDEVLLLEIVPIDGHWSRIARVISDGDTVQCSPIDDDLDRPWWQRVVGAGRIRERPAQGMRVGIIDQIFAPSDILSHVAFVDSEARRRHVLRNLYDAQISHGQRVSTILAARGPGAFCGIAHAAEILFADSTFMLGNIIDESAVDHAKVVDAVQRLSATHKADLINLSLGFDEHLPDLEDAIEEAADFGTLCICAGGNYAQKPPVIPASFAATIGVGGVCFNKVAPGGTSVEQAAESARMRGALGIDFAEFGQAFHDVDTCSGPGIDIYAPSLGIVMRFWNGIISELRGTSYASPIVTGVLACALADDDNYRTLTGRARYTYARGRLQEVSCSLGLKSLEYEGRFPRL